jgi:hypothetical protein
MRYDWGSPQELNSKLVDLLSQRHAGYVTRLVVSLEGDTVVLRGEVASEICKGDAKRLALAFEGVFKVRNELVVAAFLEAATDSGDEDYFGQGAGDEGVDFGPNPSHDGDRAIGGDRMEGPEVEVERWPVIESSGEFKSGEWIKLAVDLSVEARDAKAAIAIGRFPSDWSSIELSVQLFAPWASEMEIQDPTIVITNSGEPSPSRFRLRVSESHVIGSPAIVQVSFFHGTRICGHETWDIATIAADGLAIEGEQAPPSNEEQSRSVRVLPDAAGPSVTVIISCDSDASQSWSWRTAVPGGTDLGTGTITLDGSQREFAESLLRACPDMKPGNFRRTMRGVGEQLWRAAPSEFRDAYVSWRSLLGSDFAIQFVTQDPHIPWEMMRPDIDGLGADHLFLDHPTSRWPLSRSRRMRNSIPRGEVLSFVPEYPVHKALPSANVEGAWVVSALGGRRMEATRSAFLDVLDGNVAGPVSLLHFAGHGRVDTGVMDGGIEFEDEVVNVQEVDNSSIVLGRRDGTLVVLNACEIASGGKLLGMNTGWGAAIAAREFGGLIAPLWEIQDGVALLMVQSALPPLLDGRSTLGEAMRDARNIHGNTSIAAFAYLAHGDVMARFTTS